MHVREGHLLPPEVLQEVRGDAVLRGELDGLEHAGERRRAPHAHLLDREVGPRGSPVRDREEDAELGRAEEDLVGVLDAVREELLGGLGAHAPAHRAPRGGVLERQRAVGLCEGPGRDVRLARDAVGEEGLGGRATPACGASLNGTASPQARERVREVGRRRCRHGDYPRGR